MKGPNAVVVPVAGGSMLKTKAAEAAMASRALTDSRSGFNKHVLLAATFHSVNIKCMKYWNHNGPHIRFCNGNGARIRYINDNGGQLYNVPQR